jgi:hypothetical protein
MLFSVMADLIVAAHLTFVLFVMAGGLIVLRRRWVAWLHIPAVVWGAWIEFAGWICPLTPLENWLRERGGGEGYESSFVERYLLPVLYPEALTRDWQMLLGSIVIVVNVAIYTFVLLSGRQQKRGRRHLRIR